MKKSNWIIIAILVAASAFFLWLWYALQMNLVDNPLDLVISIIWWVVVLAACFAIHKAEQKRQERIRTAYVAIAPECLYTSESGTVQVVEGNSYVNVLQGVLEGLDYNFDNEDFPKRDDVSFCAIVRSKKFSFDKDSELKTEDDETAEDTQLGAGVAGAARASGAGAAAGVAGAAGAYGAATAANATAQMPSVAAQGGAQAGADTNSDVVTVDLEGEQTKLHEVKKWEGEVVDLKNPDEDPQEFSNKSELVAIIKSLLPEPQAGDVATGEEDMTGFLNTLAGQPA